MKIILDSNIFFSALIRDSVTRKLLLNTDEKLLFPRFILDETEKHIRLICEKSTMSKRDIKKLISILLQDMEIINEDRITNYISKAYKIVKNIDSKDTIFFACALANKNSAIWSDDKRLKDQNMIKIITTRDMLYKTY